MGRITRGTSRNIDRLGGRNAHTGWFKTLKLFLCFALLLGVFVWVSGGDAHAAEAAPHTTCGQKVKWSLSDTYAPDSAESAVQWAYQQVAKPTGTTAVSNEDEDIAWEWQSSMSGSTYQPGTTYDESGVLNDRTHWVHALDGDALDPAPALVKEQVLRLVVADFGVPTSTSTAAGLSAEDRAALKSVCKAQSEPAVGTPDVGDTVGALVDDLNPTANTQTAGSHGTPVPGGNAGLWLLLALLMPLYVYALSGDKALTFVRRLKARDSQDQTPGEPA